MVRLGGSLCVYLNRLIGVWGCGGGAVTLWTLTPFLGHPPCFPSQFTLISNLNRSKCHTDYTSHTHTHTTLFLPYTHMCRFTTIMEQRSAQCRVWIYFQFEHNHIVVCVPVQVHHAMYLHTDVVFVWRRCPPLADSVGASLYACCWAGSVCMSHQHCGFN